VSGFSAAPVNVLAAIAAAPAGGVGTYIFATTPAANFGGIVSAANIQPTSAMRSFYYGSGDAAFSSQFGALLGSWECCGKGQFSMVGVSDSEQNPILFSSNGATLYKRVE
jgi:hypothetical protein